MFYWKINIFYDFEKMIINLIFDLYLKDKKWFVFFLYNMIIICYLFLKCDDNNLVWGVFMVCII